MASLWKFLLLAVTLDRSLLAVGIIGEVRAGCFILLYCSLMWFLRYKRARDAILMSVSVYIMLFNVPTW